LCSANQGSTAVSAGQNSTQLCPTPNGWNWTKLGSRAIIKLSKIAATSCMFDYRKPGDGIKHYYWPSMKDPAVNGLTQRR
jgi:hypothetical protein